MTLRSGAPLVFLVCGVWACGSSSSSPGGETGSGSGGARPSESGGAPGTGGLTGSGGRPGSGGVTAMASGGATPSGSGGLTGSGGATSSGGTTSSSGGAAGSVGGTTGTGPGTGNPAVCAFASGLNVAWVQFAGDIPNPNLATFNTIFKNTHDAGGRVVRWWFHTNGTVTPGYDASGLTVKIPQTHIDGIKSILAAAQANGVAIDLSLWSFDMLQANALDAYVNNQKLLEVDANRQAYIDNYLTPLVKALKGLPGLYSYEIFNEPEGMSASGWATHRTTQAFINRTVNWLAAAIHDADPTALVTNGSQTFDYCSNVAGKTNNYSDASLRSAGGKMNGTLDFYEVHYYMINGISNSAFKNPASYWGLDKKLVMGEFYALATDGTAAADIYTYLYSNGYNGAWAWNYTTDDMAGTTTKWPTMQVPIQNLYSAHMQQVGSCP
jgi:Cellulase (glycosyl hydrolase family 5)